MMGMMGNITTTFYQQKHVNFVLWCFIGICGCCSALRPRYKRLVDNVFPVNADDGLVKSNMEKLTFYSVSSPEKIDRIGEYLYQKATKDINRKRYKYCNRCYVCEIV